MLPSRTELDQSSSSALLCRKTRGQACWRDASRPSCTRTRAVRQPMRPLILRELLQAALDVRVAGHHVRLLLLQAALHSLRYRCASVTLRSVT